jgi:hypothetical protein
MKKFYMIPLGSNGQALGHKVWYATWSKTRPTTTWSDVRPAIEPDHQTTWTVAIIQAEPTDQLPDGSVDLGTGGKQIPPPPLRINSGDLGPSGFQAAFRVWLTSRSL